MRASQTDARLLFNYRTKLVNLLRCKVVAAANTLTSLCLLSSVYSMGGKSYVLGKAGPPDLSLAESRISLV